MKKKKDVIGIGCEQLKSSLYPGYRPTGLIQTTIAINFNIFCVPNSTYYHLECIIKHGDSGEEPIELKLKNTSRIEND